MILRASRILHTVCRRTSAAAEEPINRANLAHEIADRLRRSIADGELTPGSRINEGALAARLEVSRTPLREALAELASEGFVSSQPRRGYFVQALAGPEVRELYTVRAVLDPAALELAGLPPAAALVTLRVWNERLLELVGDVDAIIDLDDEWHTLLLAHCPNRIILDLIRQFMQRTRPLERAYMREHANVQVSVQEHGRILDALAAGDLERGVALLRANMQSAIEPLTIWASARAGGIS